MFFEIAVDGKFPVILSQSLEMRRLGDHQQWFKYSVTLINTAGVNHDLITLP